MYCLKLTAFNSEATKVAKLQPEMWVLTTKVAYLLIVDIMIHNIQAYSTCTAKSTSSNKT